MGDIGINMKPSIYNVMLHKKDGVAIYNTKTGKIVRSFGEHAQIVKKVLQTNELVENSEIVNSLFQDGFLIDSKRDEIQEMEILERNANFDNYLKLIILPTESCNFRCVYCYEHFKRGKMPEIIQKKLVKAVEMEIENYDGLIVNWFGGEPLEAFDVIENLSSEFIKICKRTKKAYNAGITTNGYNLTVDKMRKLKRMHITEFQITLDGIPEIHDTQRVLKDGSGTFKRIIENLVNIKREIRSSVITIVLRTNFSRELLKHIDEFERLLDDYFSGDPRFCFFWQLVGDYGYIRDEKVRNIFGTMEDYTFLVHHFTEKFANKFMLQLYGPAGGVCYALKRNSYVISSDGSIKKCTCDLENEENKFGKLGENFDFEKHEKWLKREIKEDSKCYFCVKRPICHNRACYKSKSCLQNLNYLENIIGLMSDNEKYYSII